MIKNSKKPSNLSMGGVMPRRPRVTDVQPQKHAAAPKPAQAAKSKIVLKNIKSSISAKRSPASSGRTSLRRGLLYLPAAALILFLYIFKIRTFPPAGEESSLSVTHNNLSDIDSVDFLPVKLVSVIFDKAGISNPLDIRLFSVFIFLISLFFFYRLVSNWLGKKLALAALFLYACSTWSLAIARHDSEYIMLAVFLPVLLFCGAQLINSGSRIIRMLCALVLVQFIFVPGGIWIIISSVAAIGLRRGKEVNFKRLILPIIACLVVLSGYLALLFHLSLAGTTQFLRLAGLQVGEIPALGTLKANINELPGQLFVNGLNDGSFWLYLTPVIDWVSLIFFLAGIAYFITMKRNSFRAKYLLLTIIIALVLILLNGPFYISLLLPLTYIIIATGIGYLSREWLQTFPNNPLARAFGIILVCVIVAMTCAYHAERYFIGWPKTEKYRQIYDS